MGQPHEEAEDEDYERSWERVAAIDVAKAPGMVCTRVPDDDRPGRRRSRAWAVAATTGEVTALGDHLRCEGTEVVTIESTSDYRRIRHGVPEAAGLRVQLVNARAVRNVPGRAKTGEKDAAWLAKLTERGMLQPSFIPPHDIRVLREYTRLRAELVHERTRYWSRMEKLPDRALIKVTSVASSAGTRSVRLMTEALIAGERSPGRLADLARGVMRNRRKDLIAALDGKFEGRHAEEARILLRHIDAADRLDEITGCGPVAAMAVIAEIGLDMTVSGSPGRLVSWAKPCPQTRQPGKKPTAASPGKGDPWLKGPLGEVAATAARSQAFPGERYRRIATRRGRRKALVATARAILVIIYHLLADPAARFRDLGPGYYEDRVNTERKIRNHVRQLEALGLTVTVTPAEDAA